MTRPINDPTQGQWQVVVSFRMRGPMLQPPFAAEAFREALHAWADTYCGGLADLDVAVRVIGAGGERAEDEGRYDRLDDVPIAGTVRDTSQVDTGGKT